ncbi:HEAT repeat protein-like protein [Lentithecium fluviatile CBS 122367]|uniref:HEAT repeat protein-like protein n=1 Tax=Lentithecium fluviatile CBS 122367 TaxID=1168545 RepID=A0A6G1II22_9PLEO|nr:HEAT repeat protein-like protein [Lentithecium fluviatile CBS 122367]
MAVSDYSTGLPIPEQTLKDWSRDTSEIIPKFSEERDSGVKDLHAILGPLLETADTAEISPSHRAAACNLLCAIIEKCQASDTTYAWETVLDDFVWTRLFHIYLERSDNAKSKSVRQVLFVLTGVLSKSEDPRSLELLQRAVTTFVDIICRRPDRLKVKPALQGLAHLLQKNIVTIPQLLDVYQHLLDNSGRTVEVLNAQSLLTAFIAWIVHHDTSLSAGHLIKNFLVQLRRSPQYSTSKIGEIGAPIWLRPVVDCLRRWPDRMQEFKTHVFPHCFLPNINEYLLFLSFLNFERHVESKGPLPGQLESVDGRSNGLNHSEEFGILLASIEKGKELGLVKDVDYRLCQTIDVRDNALHLPDIIFEGWLSHIEPEVRLAGMYLSIYSTAVTKPITGGVLKSFKRNLVHLHTDTDGNFRRELIGYIQKLFDRLRGSTATLAKTKTKSTIGQTRIPFPQSSLHNSDVERMESHHDPLIESFRFISWYVRFLESELRPDASYQRRISALRALQVVLKSGLDPRVPYHHLSKRAQGQLQWMHELQIPNIRLSRLLLDLVMDPYDDIRDASVSILQLCLESMPDDQRKTIIGKLPRFIARAEGTMLRTGRADHADGVARAYALYFSTCSMGSAGTRGPQSGDIQRIDVLERLNLQLQNTLEVVRQNLSEAVNGRPVHGTYAAIRYIVDNDRFYGDLESLGADEFSRWKRTHVELLESFETLWNCVQSTLCADAPEGHIPEDLEEEMSLDTKEILSYSWRGLKEASVLLRAIASRAPIGANDRSLITPEAFEKFGRLCFAQLIELRHRGAFSTVAQTFAAFCRRCISAEDEILRTLPERWYQETLSSIQAKAHAITRRSGGIPALMSGIITAEPQPGGKLFPRAMHDLIAEASIDGQSSNIEESRLPQVHALNCIKEVFTTSRLSVPSEPFIGEGLELAARTLNSKIWPIRNCSLMLFKALIERLLGSDEAQDWKEQERAKTSRFSYDNYKSLVGILQSLLSHEGPLKESLDMPESNSPMDLHGAEGVFPALQILRQATPPEQYRKAIVASIQRLLGSPHWHLRDMAARTATILLLRSELPDTIKSLLAKADETANSQHGALLHAKYVLRKMLQDSANLEPDVLGTVMHDLCNWATHTYLKTNCPFTKAAFLDLVSLCGMAIIKRPECELTMEAWTKVTTTISTGPEHSINLRNAISSALLQASLAQVFFIDRSILQSACLDTMLSPTYQTIGDALLRLEASDPETCSTALDTLHTILHLQHPRGPLLQTSLIIQQIYHLTRHAHDPEILAKAQRVLASSLSLPTTPPSVFSHLAEPDLLATLDKLEAQCLTYPPSNTQSALHLLGYFLDWTYHTYPTHRKNVLARLARYIRLLRTTITDTNPFDTRVAAAQSVAALRHIWTLCPASKVEAPLLLGLTFVLYDLLNDDDDEIRDIAAGAATSLLQSQSHRRATSIKPVVPILISHRLAQFLLTTFPMSTDLVKEALRRLTCTQAPAPVPSHTQSHTPSPLFPNFTTSLTTARKPSTTLFHREKQNLYFDTTLDALLWSRVLSSLPRTAITTIPPALREGLGKWVLEGLTVLTATARKERDGALGWSSAKGEVFALGMGCVCAAGVVVRWEGSGLGSSEIGKEVGRLLVEFVEAGRASELHGLWIGRAEKVVRDGVVGVLRGAHRNVVAVQRALEG